MFNQTTKIHIVNTLDNLLNDEEPVWKQDLYTPYGKWMDGWESRRRRTEGHDWSIIQLGLPGLIRAIEVDTAFFTGNYSPKISIFAAGKTNEAVVTELLSLREQITQEREPESREHGKLFYIYIKIMGSANYRINCQ